MKYYIEYYQKSCISDELMPACGDRACVELDGRNNIETMKANAVDFNGYRRPVYLAYQIIAGDSLLRAKPITDVIPL